MPGDNLKHRFLNMNQLAFWSAQWAKNFFKVTWEHLKHRFIDFIQIAFWAGQEENEFVVPGENVKHRFLTRT